MLTHIPSGGNAVFVYGSHVGLSSNGTVGKVKRPGQ